VAQQVGQVLVDAVIALALQLVAAVPTREQAVDYALDEEPSA